MYVCLTHSYTPIGAQTLGLYAKLYVMYFG